MKQPKGIKPSKGKTFNMLVEKTDPKPTSSEVASEIETK